VAVLWSNGAYALGSHSQVFGLSSEFGCCLNVASRCAYAHGAQLWRLTLAI